MNLSSNGIVLNFDTNSITTSKGTIHPPRKQFKMITFMMNNPNRILSRHELLKACWEDDVIVGERTIDVHVCKIRKYMDNPDNLNIRKGYGYIWKEL